MTFGWDYPPGVTGNEFEISGPAETWEDQRECPHCGELREHDMQSHPDRGVWGECITCGTVTEFDDDERT